MIDEPAAARHIDETAGVLIAIGRHIRQLRIEKSLSLQSLGERTGLSASMLSLLERGKTGASIGTLVVIASALGARLSDFLDAAGPADAQAVSRARDQRIYRMTEGIVRRILKDDRVRGVEIGIDEFDAGAFLDRGPDQHEGSGYGIILEGSVTVMIGEESHDLKDGDVIAFQAADRRRVFNHGADRARALWVRVRRA